MTGHPPARRAPPPPGRRAWPPQRRQQACSRVLPLLVPAAGRLRERQTQLGVVKSIQFLFSVANDDHRTPWVSSATPQAACMSPASPTLRRSSCSLHCAVASPSSASLAAARPAAWVASVMDVLNCESGQGGAHSAACDVLLCCSHNWWKLHHDLQAVAGLGDLHKITSHIPARWQPPSRQPCA